MRVLGRIFKVIAVFYALILFASPTISAEQITSFHADIKIAKNGDITVTELISVISEGRKIRRGIFRDFPLYFIDEDGIQKRVGFDIISVKRNGEDEPHHTSYVNDSIRIYIGEEDVFIGQGQHVFEITYQTDRQMQFFDDGDELYWNVTGNFWQFQINKASARVSPPLGGTIEHTEIFTGRVGQELKFAESTISDGNRSAYFETTKALSQGEGLTIVALMPIGTVDEPTEDQIFWWFMRDFGHAVVTIITLLVVGFYYIISWFVIGRDPKASEVRERQTTSLGISPALARYILDKSRTDSSNAAFSAAILSLAVRGYITIRGMDTEPELVMGENKEFEKLPVGEAVIMDKVKKSGIFRISKSNGKSVASLKYYFNDAISKEHRNVFYEHNRPWVIFGIVLSVLGFASTLFFNAAGFISIFISLFVAGFGAAILVPMYLLSKAVRKIKNDAMRFLLLAMMIIIGLAGGAFALSVLYFAIEDSNTWHHVPFIIAVVALIGLNILFYDLLGRPTNLGAEIMAQVEGLKLHLMNYHEQRMNLASTPKMSPKYFEKQLPYAVALDVEKPWSDTFDKWLESADAVAAGVKNYDPHWDENRWYRSKRRSGTTSSGFSSHMASSITSAIPVQRSSSSSSGSSGGGGGGGGGGGW